MQNFSIGDLEPREPRIINEYAHAEYVESDCDTQKRRKRDSALPGVWLSKWDYGCTESRFEDNIMLRYMDFFLVYYFFYNHPKNLYVNIVLVCILREIVKKGGGSRIRVAG